MPKKPHSAKKNITKLRETEVLQSKSQTLVQVCKALGVDLPVWIRSSPNVKNGWFVPMSRFLP